MIYNGIFEGNRQYGDIYRKLNIYAGQDKLDLRHDLMNHSREFSVGYLGSGPSQTSLSILSHAMGDEFALKYYMRFRNDVIAKLNQKEDFALRSRDIEYWADEIIRKEERDEAR